MANDEKKRNENPESQGRVDGGATSSPETVKGQSPSGAPKESEEQEPKEGGRPLGAAQRLEAKREEAKSARELVRERTKQIKEEAEANEGAASAAGAEFSSVGGGVSIGNTGLRSQSATTGPPAEAPKTVQSEGGVEANSLGEHRLHLQAAEETSEIFTTQDENGAFYREVAGNDQLTGEMGAVSTEITNSKVGRIGAMAPKGGKLVNPKRVLGSGSTAIMNPVGANVPPNYTVLDVET